MALRATCVASSHCDFHPPLICELAEGPAPYREENAKFHLPEGLLYRCDRVIACDNYVFPQFKHPCTDYVLRVREQKIHLTTDILKDDPELVYLIPEFQKDWVVTAQKIKFDGRELQNEMIRFDFSNYRNLGIPVRFLHDKKIPDHHETGSFLLCLTINEKEKCMSVAGIKIDCQVKGDPNMEENGEDPDVYTHMTFGSDIMALFDVDFLKQDQKFSVTFGLSRKRKGEAFETRPDPKRVK